MHFFRVIGLAATLPAITHATRVTASIHTIFQFPNLTTLENLAGRANGNLLITATSSNNLFQLNPQKPSSVNTAVTIPDVTSLLGIIEFQPDVFAVVAGNFSVSPPHTNNGTYSIWKVDVSGCVSVGPCQGKKTKITDIPEGSLLNGMALVTPGSSHALVADSGLGVVWRVNLLTGEYVVAINDPLAKPPPDGLPFPIGINGVHTFGSTLYFTNLLLNGGFYGRVPIHTDRAKIGFAKGPAQVVAKIGTGDDFTLDKHGVGYVATNAQNTIDRVLPGGTFEILAGDANSTILEGTTAAQFGRTTADCKTLYVVTNGGLAGPVPGTYREGGKVVAIET